MDNDKNVARAAALDTATLSDALDRHGINGQCYRIHPRSSDSSMAGRAWTLLYGPAASPAGTVGDYLDEVSPGSVVVLDNGGRDDATVWGDILTELAYRKGIAGTLIDGINRDVALSLELGYPIYSRGHWMRTGKDRVQVEATGTPVTIGGARVCPGDLIRGDADGVVVIPWAHENAVLTSAETIQKAEDAIRASVRGGMSLREAREKHRYHALQTRDATASEAAS
jgi:4-hydroxy-4-methyl-2-oxoglutarate aldolase